MTNKAYVWDPLVRFFHWTLVLAFVIAYFTGDEENTLHIYSSYYILGLVGIRVLWGMIGTRYARFLDFMYSPAAVMDYLKGFLGKGSGKHYLGHNPAGGWMVVALLLSLLATGISGLKVYGLEGQGPLAQGATPVHLDPSPGLIKVSSDDREHYELYDHDIEDQNENERTEADEEFWEELHEFFANFTVLLVFLHIGGVIASSLKQRQNLVKAMITGYKRRV